MRKTYAVVVCVLLVLMILGQLVDADGPTGPDNCFSILGVGSYPIAPPPGQPDVLTDLGFDDCNQVYNKFRVTLNWYITQYDGDVGTVAPAPVYSSPTEDETGSGCDVRAYDATEGYYSGSYQADRSDFLWCMGHGGTAKWYLKNCNYYSQTAEELFNSADVGTAWQNQALYITTSKWDDNLEWVFFMMCSVLYNSDTYLVPWAKTMLGDNRVHALFGYRTEMGSTSPVTSEFLAQTTVSNATLTSAWKSASEKYGQPWAYLVHEGNLADHFWGRGTVTGDTTGAPVIYYYYSTTRRRVYVQNDRGEPAVSVASGLRTARDFAEAVPKERPSLPAMALEQEQPADPSAYGFVETDPNVVAGSNAYGRTYCNRSLGRILRVWDNGAVEFVADVPYVSSVSLSPDEAAGTALAFVQSHGGLPEDAILARVSEVRRHQVVPEGSERPEETMGYVFEYEHSINGLPFGPGDLILVSVGPAGVDHYLRSWRHIAAASGESRQVVPADTALGVASSRWPSGSPLIRGMRLIYWAEPYAVPQEKAFPVWLVEVEQGDPIAVNGFTGAIIQPPPDVLDANDLGIPMTPDIEQIDPDDLGG